uniref:Cleft lip and palate associated transmembrane protein n=1 Tax=Polytomella parva TaxID=51329 RepID=A0A7S0YSI7_9CHLO|mmetsp:Transcript_34972/g.62873  ORF Transcript_34972/g.62873 Transcript_34972/m.62873 type:complete len:621 (+) Transcript_34972:208-2070(+)|eukprot:CAMPEP_0175055772 /NCGR_PEP_ID=MMETSP0052_2-20121109/10276_1 /TAXON_ID=51329 ORGANISM="Polytomella parva, Strain SAG 63-3" /NCGR_SAMPLE_ID=MMETSP0052_2 /ASSEMBLY_ACC=CAM_ASM_000194 /LENGTH=620 /DNA_ID=CAMNT_0016320675 /DNA_START=194 /DNA_END=2056 /DNA_ORIENTATION=-
MHAPTPVGAAATRENPSAWQKLLGGAIRMVIMWYVINSFKSSREQAVKKQYDIPDVIEDTNPQTSKNSWVESAVPVFEKGNLADVYLFISDRKFLPPVEMSELAWFEPSFAVGVDKRNATYVYNLPEHVRNNKSTIYLHTVIAKPGEPIVPSEPGYDNNNVFHYSFPLSAHIPRRKNSTGVSLLDQPKTDAEIEAAPAAVSYDPKERFHYLRPNLTVQFVDHFEAYVTIRKVPPQIFQAMEMDEGGNYRPIIYFNDFWLLKEHMIPVNETLESVTLNFDLGSIAVFWWQLQKSIESSFQMQTQMGISQDADSDEIKRVFIEGNPYFLALTMFVSLLHTVFDMLAFKNDIGFWRENKSMEGLSARTVIINAACQVIVLLYLFDNDTSFVVLASSFVGTAIEIWKVTKAFSVTTQPNWPFIKISDRASYANRDTKQHDEDANRYLGYALFPLVIGYALWSLKYRTHKSWYSWIVSSLVGAVYMFGFILMCPQLYLNYKLKSVAHLPWRQMTYKFLNTIVDDLFAFVIKMPLLHRISVFRDDVIFLIYIYQRWIYRVDKSRTNEFGWSEAEADKERLEQEKKKEMVSIREADAAEDELEAKEKEEEEEKKEKAAAAPETKKDK